MANETKDESPFLKRMFAYWDKYHIRKIITLQDHGMVWLREDGIKYHLSFIANENEVILIDSVIKSIPN